MPHLYLEYSDNLATFDAATALQQANLALEASGQFSEIDIKSRASMVSCYQVGTARDPQRAFIHARLAILEGRSEAVQQTLAQLVLDALLVHCPADPALDVQVSCEIQQIARASYAKQHRRGQP
jgi:5-carboxymethyl-2-hydroxymuconate isomerase